MLTSFRAKTRSSLLRCRPLWKQDVSTLYRAFTTSTISLTSRTPDPTEYLHNSVIPTRHFQDSLPRLPIPELDATLDKYLYFVKPVVDESTYEEAVKHVESFRKGEGPELQKELVETDKENKHTSFISDMWYDMYLENRASLPINITPHITWAQDPIPSKNEQPVKAANIIASALRYYRSLRDETLNPEVFVLKDGLFNKTWYKRFLATLPRSIAWYGAYAVNAFPLDMYQYDRLFSSTRIPKKEKDELVSFNGSQHIIVIKGSQFYKVNVIQEDGTPLDHATIEAQIRGIAEAKDDTSGPAVGALTGWTRDEWAKARGELESDPRNKDLLETVDSALFAITLDESHPKDHEEIMKTMLHGDCRDRWFDKSFNIVICADGRAGITWEHAWGDGVAILSFFNECFNETTGLPEREKSSAIAVESDNAFAPSRLQWNLSDSVKRAIKEATDYNDERISRLDLDIYESESLTRNDIKKSQLSPDGVMQMVLQIAHRRAHGYTPSTYESASTAGFKHGRTETIRSATPEALEMCQLLDDKTVDKSAKFAALQKATSNHSKVSTDCKLGKGVDRHLYALNKYAERRNISPAIFNNAAWRTMQDIRLSTSTLSSPALDGGGFGPVSETAYSVGYGTADRGAHFAISSFGQGNDQFKKSVESALQDIKEVSTSK